MVIYTGEQSLDICQFSDLMLHLHKTAGRLSNRIKQVSLILRGYTPHCEGSNLHLHADMINNNIYRHLPPIKPTL